MSNQNPVQTKANPPTQPILMAPTKKERFLLIAADQGMGSPNERLNRVIQAKYEAGLLKPYNYVKGYARLSKWMDRKCALILHSIVIFFLLTFYSSSPTQCIARF